MKLLLIFAFTLLFQNYSYAGPHIIGNGGNALVCDKNGQKSAELLDFFEAKILLSLNLKLDANKNYQDLAFEMIARLKPSTRFDQMKLKTWVKKFSEEARFLSDVNLVSTEDSYHFIVPNNCKIEQLAIQKKPELPGDQLYTINKDVWALLDNVSKAGLIVHEIIYRQSIENFGSGEGINSIPVRYLLAYLASDTLKDLSIENLKSLEEKLGFSESRLKAQETLFKNEWITEVSTSETGIKMQYELRFLTETTAEMTAICTYSSLPEFEGVEDDRVSLAFSIFVAGNTIKITEDKFEKKDSGHGSWCGLSITQASSYYRLYNSGKNLALSGMSFRRK